MKLHFFIFFNGIKIYLLETCIELNDCNVEGYSDAVNNVRLSKNLIK